MPYGDTLSQHVLQSRAPVTQIPHAAEALHPLQTLASTRSKPAVCSSRVTDCAEWSPFNRFARAQRRSSRRSLSVSSSLRGSRPLASRKRNRKTGRGIASDVGRSNAAHIGPGWCSFAAVREPLDQPPLVVPPRRASRRSRAARARLAPPEGSAIGRASERLAEGEAVSACWLAMQFGRRHLTDHQRQLLGGETMRRRAYAALDRYREGRPMDGRWSAP